MFLGINLWHTMAANLATPTWYDMTYKISGGIELGEEEYRSGTSRCLFSIHRHRYYLWLFVMQFRDSTLFPFWNSNKLELPFMQDVPNLNVETSRNVFRGPINWERMLFRESLRRFFFFFVSPSWRKSQKKGKVSLFRLFIYTCYYLFYHAYYHIVTLFI